MRKRAKPGSSSATASSPPRLWDFVKTRFVPANQYAGAGAATERSGRRKASDAAQSAAAKSLEARTCQRLFELKMSSGKRRDLRAVQHDLHARDPGQRRQGPHETLELAALRKAPTNRA